MKLREARPFIRDGALIKRSSSCIMGCSSIFEADNRLNTMKKKNGRERQLIGIVGTFLNQETKEPILAAIDITIYVQKKRLSCIAQPSAFSGYETNAIETSWFKRERENKRGALINSSGIFTTGPPPAPTGPPPAPTTGPPPDHRRCTTCTHQHIGPLMHHRRTTAGPPQMTLIYDADAEADEEMLTLMSIWYLLTPHPLFFLRSDYF
ncbi:hypothetical protein LXL04_014584 [Taraxacum kok-saghyz]